MVSMVVQLAEPVRDRRAASTRRAPGRDQAAPAAISATLQRYEGPSRCGGVVGALVVSLAGSSSPSCWGMVAAVVCGVGSVAGGSARRPRRRTKATEAARAPAAPVRTAASRFFPAPRESSRDSRDVRSPKALPRLAGNPGLPLARERLGRRRAATAAGRDAGCLLAPREARQAAWKACGSPAVGLTVAVRFPWWASVLPQVGQCVWGSSAVRDSSPSIGSFPQKFPAAFAMKSRPDGPTPRDRRADGHEPRHLPRRPGA